MSPAFQLVVAEIDLSPPPLPEGQHTLLTLNQAATHPILGEHFDPTALWREADALRLHTTCRRHRHYTMRACEPSPSQVLVMFAAEAEERMDRLASTLAVVEADTSELERLRASLRTEALDAVFLPDLAVVGGRLQGRCGALKSHARDGIDKDFYAVLEERAEGLSACVMAFAAEYDRLSEECRIPEWAQIFTSEMVRRIPDRAWSDIKEVARSRRAACGKAVALIRTHQSLTAERETGDLSVRYRQVGMPVPHVHVQAAKRSWLGTERLGF